LSRRRVLAGVLFGVVAAAASPAAPGRAASDPAHRPGPLTALEFERLRAGALVVKTADLPNFPWPEVTVYRRIAATPAQVMAVYVDFESQAAYMPGLATSRIVKREGPSLFHVFYEAEVTGPNERYTVAMSVARAARAFQATWHLLMARYARQLSGSLIVEPFDGGALLTYTNRVDPGILGVAFGTPESVSRRVQATIDALAARVEGLAAGQPTYLADLVSGLESIVDGDRGAAGISSAADGPSSAACYGFARPPRTSSDSTSCQTRSAQVCASVGVRMATGCGPAMKG
jgi:hypothetical protein